MIVTEVVFNIECRKRGQKHGPRWTVYFRPVKPKGWDAGAYLGNGDRVFYHWDAVRRITPSVKSAKQLVKLATKWAIEDHGRLACE